MKPTILEASFRSTSANREELLSGFILGLFSFGIFTKHKVKDKYVWIVALVCVSIIVILGKLPAETFGGYGFVYELPPLNGLLTFIGLWLIRKNNLTGEVYLPVTARA